MCNIAHYLCENALCDEIVLSLDARTKNQEAREQRGCFSTQMTQIG